MTHQEKIKRSVDSLERIYSVVVALAVTIAIQRFLFNSDGRLRPWEGPDGAHVYFELSPSIIAFVLTIVPFYHGMNRHLDQIYIERVVPDGKEGFLLLDFVAFFLESCLLVAFASLVAHGDAAFVVLIILFAGDLIWAAVAHGIHYGEWKLTTLRWSAINFIAVVILLVVYYSNVFESGAVRSWALCGTVILRTVADYVFCWRFYFPEKS